MSKRLFYVVTGLCICFAAFPLNFADACSRAVYFGKLGQTVTGRTMDWQEDMHTDLWIFPRGMKRDGGMGKRGFQWTSKYGSVIASAYEAGTADGMNEKGLVANLLFLVESEYPSPEGDNRPLVIHHGRQFQVMTNSPIYDQQLALNEYWKQIGGTVMLPGTNRAADRFARASFYINAAQQSADSKEAVSSVFSVMRNVSVPRGISTPNQPNISSTIWRTVADQKNRVYYFEETASPSVVWVDLKRVDFAEGTGIRKLDLHGKSIVGGDQTGGFKNSEPFVFLAPK